MLLAATLFCCLFVPIHSVAASINTVRIATKAEWLEFKENCRLDSFSKGLSVNLTADIDLSDRRIMPFPCSETFDGGGHTVSGMKPNTDAERTGLFRIIEKDATVCELNVSGFRDRNRTIRNGGDDLRRESRHDSQLRCSAVLDAYNAVGGIAGINEQSGKIIECSSSAELSGTYKIGGIVGVNAGENQSPTLAKLLQCDTSDMSAPPSTAGRLPALSFALLAAFVIATAIRTHNDTTIAIAIAIVIASVLMFACCWVSAAHLLGTRAALQFVLIAVSLGWFAEQMGSSRAGFSGTTPTPTCWAPACWMCHW